MVISFCAAGIQPDWDGSMAQDGVPAAAYLSYTVISDDGSGVYIAYNPYEGPVPAILPDPPSGCGSYRFKCKG